MIRLIYVFSMFLLIQACDPGMVYDHFEKTPGGNWNWNEPLTFSVDMQDKDKSFNIYLSVRHTRDYPKSNLYVFLDVTSPAGATLRDTIEFTLAEPSGKWTGHGFGSTVVVRKLYRQQTHFPNPGTYTFRIEQAMRLEEVPVTDVGLRIEHFQQLR